MSQTTSNAAEYSVSEIANAVKRTVEANFGYVRVRGEISGYRGAHGSGHAYFSLKDDKARLEAVIWKTTYQRLKFKPEEGLEVIATGKISTFPGSSKYQLIIDALEPAGVGALMALLEERKKRLAAEGLFAEARKKPLPHLPRLIGVITSPTGAVIHDILHRLADRFPVPVILWPVRVQGETAAAEVAQAIRGFNAPNLPFPRPDVLIVARGGGSLEDLWGFNEEIVVRAAAASNIPIISAVGHETDTTLIDFVADKRAPTPTGAAEIAVPVRSKLIADLDGCARRLSGAADRGMELRQRDLRAAARALPSAEDILAVPRRALDEAGSRLSRSLTMNTLAHRHEFARVASRIALGQLQALTVRSAERLNALSARKLRALGVLTERKAGLFAATERRLRPDVPRQRLQLARERLAAAETRAEQAVYRNLTRRDDELENLWRLLNTVSYRGILARGFTLVHRNGVPVRSASEVSTGAPLDLEFHDGRVGAVATEAPRLRPVRGPRRRILPGQGELL